MRGRSGRGMSGGRRSWGVRWLAAVWCGRWWLRGGVASAVLVGAAVLLFAAGASRVGVPTVAGYGQQPASGEADGQEASAGDDEASGSSEATSESREDSSEPSSQGDEDVAEDACHERLARLAGPQNRFDMQLIGAYPTSVGEAADAHERRRGGQFRSELRDRAPTSFAAVCFFEAEAIGLAHPPPGGRPVPDGVHTRLQEVVLLDGEAVGFAVGRDEIRPAPLSGGEAR